MPEKRIINHSTLNTGMRFMCWIRFYGPSNRRMFNLNSNGNDLSEDAAGLKHCIPFAKLASVEQVHNRDHPDHINTDFRRD